MQRPPHAQRIEPALGVNAIAPRQDRAIEHGVVGQHKRCLPRQGAQHLRYEIIRACHPVGGTIVDLVRKPDNLKLLRANVLLGADFRQAELRVVVGFHVNCNYVHIKHPYMIRGAQVG